MRTTLLMIAMLPLLISCSSTAPPTDPTGAPPAASSTSSSSSPSSEEIIEVEGENARVDFDGVPQAVVVGDEVEVVLYGSSSCPPTPDSITVEGTVLVVKLQGSASESVACTADYGPSIWKTASPDNVEDAVTGEIVSADGISHEPLILVKES